ncbi:hypothetical protein PC114_g14683 [Phytophthora cactorum]|nr:hypothetical protein PC114_g14683 [Phytophthora cactorum]
MFSVLFRAVHCAAARTCFLNIALARGVTVCSPLNHVCADFFFAESVATAALQKMRHVSKTWLSRTPLNKSALFWPSTALVVLPPSNGHAAPYEFAFFQVSAIATDAP